jgi:hypothetical protein
MRITLRDLKRLVCESAIQMSHAERHERVGYGFLGTVKQDGLTSDADKANDAALDAVAETLGMSSDEAQCVLDSNLGRHLADGLGAIDPSAIYASVYDSVAAQVIAPGFKRAALRAIGSERQA